MFGFGGIGLLLIYWFIDSTFSILFTTDYSFSTQLTAGIVTGILSAVIALSIIRTKWVAKSASKYEVILSRLDLSIPGILFISFCAGFGEELFFRGFAQHYLGIIITSILFVAIHGYLNPKDVGISIYGLVMVLIIIVFGCLFKEMGILAPATAHFIFDVILLASIRFKSIKKSTFAEEIKDYEKN